MCDCNANNDIDIQFAIDSGILEDAIDLGGPPEIPEDIYDQHFAHDISDMSSNNDYVQDAGPVSFEEDDIYVNDFDEEHVISENIDYLDAGSAPIDEMPIDDIS